MSDLARIETGIHEVDIDAIAPAILNGDLSKLSPEERIKYHNAVCISCGLNPATQPFEFLTFQGKKKLYPKKECAEQLRKMHRISLGGPDIKFNDGLIIVTITATDPSSRS
jgi:hypothetical protein